MNKVRAVVAAATVAISAALAEPAISDELRFGASAFVQGDHSHEDGAFPRSPCSLIHSDSIRRLTGNRSSPGHA